MKSSVKLIAVKGITVYLHFTFILFLLWIIGLYMATGMEMVQLSWSVLFVLAVFACIVLHEYGHALVAARFGINAQKITLYPIGGIASIEKLPQNPRQELLISGAGPLVSICLGAGLLLFTPYPFSWQSFQEYTGTISKDNFLYSLGLVNMALALFNLLPAFPMDGGRILRALLAYRFNYIKATAIAASVGRVIAVMMILAGVVTMNLILLLVGLFVLLFARAEESYLQLKELVKDMQVKEVLMYDYDRLDADLTISGAADILQNNHSKRFIIVREGMPLGTLNRMKIMEALAEKNYALPVTEIMEEDLESLEAETPVADVLEKLASDEERLFPVFENGFFAGVINFQHLLEYLLIHKAASKDYSKTKSLTELV